MTDLHETALVEGRKLVGGAVDERHAKATRAP